MILIKLLVALEMLFFSHLFANLVTIRLRCSNSKIKMHGSIRFGGSSLWQSYKCLNGLHRKQTTFLFLFLFNKFICHCLRSHDYLLCPLNLMFSTNFQSFQKIKRRLNSDVNIRAFKKKKKKKKSVYWISKKTEQQQQTGSKKCSTAQFQNHWGARGFELNWNRVNWRHNFK